MQLWGGLMGFCARHQVEVIDVVSSMFFQSRIRACLRVDDEVQESAKIFFATFLR